MNKADQEAGNKAVDSLINYETVKYFNNEAYEAETYDKSLMQYEKAAIRTSETLAKLNFGQQVIFNIALSCVMLLAANKITEGKMTGKYFFFKRLPILLFKKFLNSDFYLISCSWRSCHGKWITISVVYSFGFSWFNL